MGLAGIRVGTVLDPACGTGSLLVAFAGRDATLLGQEIDPGLAALAEVRLALRNVPTEVHAADSLLNDAYRGRFADVVVCDPPVGERQWGHEELMHDERWEYGIPPRMESELAWVQHALAHVKPMGLVAILMPPSVAARRSGRRIRAELLRRGALRAVIALPGPVHLWLLRRPGPEVDQNLLVVEATTKEWEQAGRLVLSAWRAFDDPSDSGVLNQPGVYRSVPVLDLLGEEVDLTPARNLPVTSAPDTAEKLLAGHRELSSRLASLGPMLPAVDWTGAARERRVTMTVAELIKTGRCSCSSPTCPPTAAVVTPCRCWTSRTCSPTGHPPAGSPATWPARPSGPNPATSSCPPPATSSWPGSSATPAPSSAGACACSDPTARSSTRGSSPGS
ncbi:hypothetical protein GCM10029964_074890 [Kibdelosporangium lantanae]